MADDLREKAIEAARVELAKGAYEMPGDTLPRLTKATQIADAVLAVVDPDDVLSLVTAAHGSISRLTNERDAAVREAAALRAGVLAYLGEREHPDDWGVTCVYTDGLRALLAEHTPEADRA